MTTAKAQEQRELPWFTEEELQGIAAIHEIALTSGDYDIPVASWQITVRQLLHVDTFV